MAQPGNKETPPPPRPNQRPRSRSRRLIRWAIVGSVVIVVGALGAVAWQLWPRTDRFYTDADTIQEPLATATVRDVLWKPPQRLGESLNTDQDDYEARVSADGLSLYFVRGKAGQNADIYYCRRTSAGWSKPAPLESINSEYDELGPGPSPDGDVLYFYSDRPGGLGGYDLWAAHRRGDGRSDYSQPINLGPGVNTPFSDYGPAVTPDGATLYFASNRPRGEDAGPPPDAWLATIREDLYVRDYDLYEASISDRGVSQVVALDELNSPYNEGVPSVSPVGDFLYFASDRPGGQGGFDLYRARRLHGAHLSAVNLGDTVNTGANELDPALGMGGFALYFSSNRPDSANGDSSPNDYDIFYTTSREVFADARVTRATIDWAGIWDRIATTLLLALLALLALLTLLALIGNLRTRRLTLLARCLLGSMLAHLLLLLLLTLWHVSSGLSDLDGPGGGKVHVTLAPPATGDGLAAQIRGQFTAVEAPPATQEPARRAEQVILVSAPILEASIPVPPTQIAWPSESSIEMQVSDAVVDRNTPITAQPPAASIVEQPVNPTTIPVGPLPVTVADSSESPVQESVPLDAPTDSVRADLPVDSPPPDAPVQVMHVHPRIAERWESQTDAPSLADRAVLRESVVPPGAADKLLTETPELTEPSTAPSPTALALVDAVALPMEVAPVQRDDTPVAGAQGVMPSVMPSVTPPDARRADAASTNVDLSQTEPGISPFAIAPELPVDTRAVPSLAKVGKVAAMDASPPIERESPNFDSSVYEPPNSGPVAINVGLPGETQPQEAIEPVDGSTVSPMDVAAATRSDAAVSGIAEDVPTVVATHLLTPVEGADRGSSPPSLVEDTASTMQRSSVVNAPSLWTDTFDVPTAEPLSIGLPIAFSLDLPEEAPNPDDSYAQRSAASRLGLVQRKGGSEKTEVAVALALRWLAAHQSADGNWDGDAFDEQCGECGGETDNEVDVGITGLATLSFLAADHTHVNGGQYQSNVRRALRWLRSRQRPDGDLRGGETMYSHGIAAIALAEALGMTGDESLRQPVTRAVEFIGGARARNRKIGGWRYDPGQAGDTSVLGWQIMALKSARLAGVQVPWEDFDEARRWLQRVSYREYPGRYSYKLGRPPSPSMTAEGMFVQQIIGRQPEDRRMQESASYLLDHRPLWESDANTYYWYYATLALYQHGGDPWRRWNRALTPALLGAQRQDEKAAGSWDPIGQWAHIGGRVYQTALCTLMLEVYYRYLPMYGPQAPADAIGTIRGHVVDADTGTGIAGAVVKLDLPDRPAIVVETGEDGSYELFPPEVPEFFALSAASEGFLPHSSNVATSMVMGSVLELDFPLRPHDRMVIAIEAVPDVHHLGDNAFSGTINSQFQKEAEGAVFERSFVVLGGQLRTTVRRAQISLLAKGVQEAHRIHINGTELADRLDRSPRDGSFGEFTAVFDAGLLHAGDNVLHIYASSRGSDVDDFEFVNVQIRLLP